MRAQTTKLYHWAQSKAGSSKAPLWIGLLFFLEVALFIPLDAILMFFCLQDRRKIFLYIALATCASTISALLGYFLGHFLWDLIGPYVVPHFIAPASFDRLTFHLQAYENWAVFFGSLLPLPLKALSIAAGVFHLGPLPFLAYFLLARLLRFSLIGAAMILWGEKIKLFVDKHFHKIFMFLGAKVAAVFLLFWAFAK